MDFPDRAKGLILMKTLRQGDAIRIRGSKPFDSDAFHVFIVLNSNISGDAVAVTVNGTTQIEKRLSYYTRLKISIDEMPLVFIGHNKYSFFSKDTCIDCNNVLTIDLSTIDNDNIICAGRIDDDDLEKIINKVLSSNQVAPIYKNMIKRGE